MNSRRTCEATVIAALAVVGLVGTAQADGYSAAPRVAYEKPANWTGLYGGIDGGWMGTDFDWAFNPPIPGAPHQSYSLRTDSGFVGVHGGYQQQFGAIVLGVEAAGSISRSNWASETGFSILPSPFTSEARLKNLITVGPRLGFATSSLLFYGTGGWARADIDSRGTINGVIPVFDSGNQHNGWFAGGGVELLVGKNAFIGLEYKHVALDTERHCAVGGVCVPFLDRDVSADADIVTARLSLKWGFEDRAAPLK